MSRGESGGVGSRNWLPEPRTVRGLSGDGPTLRHDQRWLSLAGNRDRYGGAMSAPPGSTPHRQRSWTWPHSGQSAGPWQGPVARGITHSTTANRCLRPNPCSPRHPVRSSCLAGRCKGTGTEADCCRPQTIRPSSPLQVGGSQRCPVRPFAPAAGLWPGPVSSEAPVLPEPDVATAARTRGPGRRPGRTGLPVTRMLLCETQGSLVTPGVPAGARCDEPRADVIRDSTWATLVSIGHGGSPPRAIQPTGTDGLGMASRRSAVAC